MNEHVSFSLKISSYGSSRTPYTILYDTKMHTYYNITMKESRIVFKNKLVKNSVELCGEGEKFVSNKIRGPHLHRSCS